MEEKVTRKISKKVGGKPVVFDATALDPVSSAGAVTGQTAAEKVSGDAVPSEPVSEEKTYSPEFLELARPKLPNLARSGDRARLLMQSPNRLYFYWSVGKNPFHTLNRALGQAANYALVLKLVDLATEDELIHPVDASGNWWFDVDSDRQYRAEIGFYAVNRPYIRILYSNTIATPRKSPSPRSAETAEWRVPAATFAIVLEAAGFQRDAFDVVLAGDDADAADAATRSAFAEFSGKQARSFASIEASELRYAMFALASGVPLAELRGLISERLFRFLSGLSAIDSDHALTALRDKFEFDADEFDIEEESVEGVYGNSLINFPRRTKKSRRLSDLNPLNPLSSLNPRS